MLASHDAASNSNRPETEDTMTRKKTVSLMLLDNIDNLGIVGDVVEVNTPKGEKAYEIQRVKFT